MKKRKPTPWLKIKAEYLQGCKPVDLAKKYGLTSNTIRSKASQEKWGEEKQAIINNLQQNTEERIQGLTTKALQALENVIDSDTAENKDKVAAAKAILDISGLKKSTKEITGKDGSPIIQQNYVMPTECNSAIEHIKDFIKNG